MLKFKKMAQFSGFFGSQVRIFLFFDKAYKSLTGFRGGMEVNHFIGRGASRDEVDQFEIGWDLDNHS